MADIAKSITAGLALGQAGREAWDKRKAREELAALQEQWDKQGLAPQEVYDEENMYTRFQLPSTGQMYDTQEAATAAMPKQPSYAEQLRQMANVYSMRGMTDEAKGLIGEARQAEEAESLAGYRTSLMKKQDFDIRKGEYELGLKEAEDARAKAARDFRDQVLKDAGTLKGYERDKFIMNSMSSEQAPPGSFDLYTKDLERQGKQNEARVALLMQGAKESFQQGNYQGFADFYAREVLGPDENGNIPEIFASIEGSQVNFYELGTAPDGTKVPMGTPLNAEPLDVIDGVKDIMGLINYDNAVAVSEAQTKRQLAAQEVARQKAERDLESAEKILAEAADAYNAVAKPNIMGAISGNENDISVAKQRFEDAQAAVDAARARYMQSGSPRPGLQPTSGGASTETPLYYAYINANDRKAAELESVYPELVRFRKERENRQGAVGPNTRVFAPPGMKDGGVFSPSGTPPKDKPKGPIFKPYEKANGGLVRKYYGGGRYPDGGDLGMNMDDYEIEKAAGLANARVERDKADAKIRSSQPTMAERAKGAVAAAALAAESGPIDDTRLTAMSPVDFDMRYKQPEYLRSGGLVMRDYRRGGAVKGPGTETSDSIPARLSDGEYVVNAESMKIAGVPELLEAINKMGLQKRKIKKA